MGPQLCSTNTLISVLFPCSMSERFFHNGPSLTPSLSPSCHVCSMQTLRCLFLSAEQCSTPHSVCLSSRTCDGHLAISEAQLCALLLPALNLTSHIFPCPGSFTSTFWNPLSLYHTQDFSFTCLELQVVLREAPVHLVYGHREKDPLGQTPMSLFQRNLGFQTPPGPFRST